MTTKNPSSLSKHLVRRDLERDPDHINQMLWKRKIYKKRVERNELKKVRKHYFKEKESGNHQGPTENEGLPVVDAKKDEFYKQLFSKTEGEDKEIDARRQRRPKKARDLAKPSAENTSITDDTKEKVNQEEITLQKEFPEISAEKQAPLKTQHAGGSFNKQLDRIKEKKEQERKIREDREKERQKKIKKKVKYAKKLNQKTSKGQPLMKNLIAHYLSKLEKGQ